MEKPSPRRKRVSELGSLEDAELAFLALLLRRPGREATADETVTEEERRSFYRTAGNFYKARRKEIETLHLRGLSLNESAVALHLARHASVTSEEVLRLRLEGISWADMLNHFSLSPEIFYVPFAGPMEPMPRRPYGYYSGKARQAWNVLALSDADIVNLVNLKFISEYYGHRPERVIALCSTGWSFAAIHAEANRSKPLRKATKRTSGPKRVRK